MSSGITNESSLTEVVEVVCVDSVALGKTQHAMEMLVCTSASYWHWLGVVDKWLMSFHIRRLSCKCSAHILY